MPMTWGITWFGEDGSGPYLWGLARNPKENGRISRRHVALLPIYVSGFAIVERMLTNGIHVVIIGSGQCDKNHK
jgi:hypothetical protein